MTAGSRYDNIDMSRLSHETANQPLTGWLN